MNSSTRYLLAQQRATELIEEARLARLASERPSARPGAATRGTAPTAVRALIRRLVAWPRSDPSGRLGRAWRVGPTREGAAVDRP